ncbi:MAG: hypothetical protein H6825_09090 [Planctomycetes bacterium]|nr:hypothetical protein [Planctomycetota bacterium]
MHRILLVPLLGLVVAGQAAGQSVPRADGDPSGTQGQADGADPVDAVDAVDLRGSDTIQRFEVRPDGGARRMSGAFATTGTDAASRAGDFLKRYGGLFGLDDGVELEALPRTRLSPQRMRFVQRVHGHLLRGHGIDLRFDDRGVVREAHGVIDPTLGDTPGPVLDADDARSRAVALAGLDPDRIVSGPDVEETARLTADGLQLVHRVSVVRDDHLPLVIEIDARDGTLLSVSEDGVHGSTAIFKYDGDDVTFPTSSGKGDVYKSVKKATTESEAFTSLKHLASADAGSLALAGTLTGRYAQVVDADGLQIYNPESQFAFADDGSAVFGSFPDQISEYQLFDHVNTYCWLDRMGSWFSKVLGDFDGDYSVLTYVNFDNGGDGYVNALYSPSDPDGAGGYDPGYFLFGEFTAVSGDPMDDLSRDPTIVCHEYTHMVVDKAGGTFGDDELDTPPRAVNEGLADYASGSSLKDELIGHSFMLHAGADLDLEGDAFRDLGSEITLVDDLWREIGFYTGFPEEHRAGEIFAAALWSVRKAVKSKTADAAILTGLLGWPMSTAEVGFPVVDTDNVEDCYTAYFWGCAESLVDQLLDQGGKKGQKYAGKALGAFMRHGISGVLPDTIYDFDASDGLTLSFESAFLGSIDEQAFAIDLAEGQKISVSIKGVGGTTVDFDLDDTPGELERSADKKVNGKQTKASQSGITVLSGRTYTLTLSDPSGEGGRYKLLVKVK